MPVATPEDIHIVSGPTIEKVGTKPAGQNVGASPGLNFVVALQSVDYICAGSSDQVIILRCWCKSGGSQHIHVPNRATNKFHPFDFGGIECKPVRKRKFVR